MERLLYGLTFVSALGAALVAGIFFAFSSFVTVACNVPLNDALEAVTPESAEGASLWKRYLSEWTMWNHVRMAAPLASAASFMMSLVK